MEFSSAAFIEACPFPALLIGRNERIEAVNSGATRLFGAGVVGRHYITALRQPDLLDAVERTIREGTGTEAPFLTTEAQRDMTMLALVRPIKPQGGTFVTFEDRTALQEAGQIRRDFVANVSHELRTPLTALLGFIETLRGAARDDPDARERFLSIMEAEAGRMNRLVDDLLSLSRVEAEERRRPEGRVDISALIREVIERLRPLSEDRQIAIEGVGLVGETILPGDADQLSQVVSNLLENALKYSRPDTTVNVTLSVEARNPMIRGSAVIISVSDQGEGIDPTHIPRLTERFYRIDTHRSREMGGTGLGLAIVKHIVNRHRGRLRISSRVGEGSEFAVILPMEAGNSAD